MDFVVSFINAVWRYLSEVFILLLIVFVCGVLFLFIYDRYVQRKHSLLINYPVIGRFRYFFEALREPLRQYFGDEEFYESRDKIDWVYTAAKDKPNFKSFSISQPYHLARFLIKHSNAVLNNNEVEDDFSVIFGEQREIPYVSSSIIFRSATSDGALSPEATRAFAMASAIGKFPMNIGEGSLTSNHLFTLKPDPKKDKYLEIVHPTSFSLWAYRFFEIFFNRHLAAKIYRRILLGNSKYANTYIYDPDTNILFRINWEAPLEDFPSAVPEELPDLVFQISSGLYGVRDKNGNFDATRYKKIMSFCVMTEIKIAQGAKQTGGKLAASKVTPDIAYYRGVEEGKNLFAPNRFPFADTMDELMDFVEELQNLSGKPVGIKVVISDYKQAEEIVVAIKKKKEQNKPILDFISVDSGEGGSATAPLELMESVGLDVYHAVYIMDDLLREYGLRDDIKIIGSGKILTPDDVVIVLSLGADAVAIGRGFMMSGGCIRARKCGGFGGDICPVGMATQDPKRRRSYLVYKEAREIANYHKNLLKGIKTVLAVMGKRNIKELNRKNLSFINKEEDVFFDINAYFRKKIHS